MWFMTCQMRRQRFMVDCIRSLYFIYNKHILLHDPPPLFYIYTSILCSLLTHAHSPQLPSSQHVLRVSATSHSHSYTSRLSSLYLSVLGDLPHYLMYLSPSRRLHSFRFVHHISPIPYFSLCLTPKKFLLHRTYPSRSSPPHRERASSKIFTALVMI